MPIYAFIILTVTLLAFAFGLAWFLISSFTVKFPEGKRLTYAVNKRIVHIVVSEPILGLDTVATACARAVGASCVAWSELSKMGRVKKRTLDEAVVWIAPLIHIEATAKMMGFKILNGYIAKAQSGGFNFKELPMAVISPLVTGGTGQLLMTGEPVIHEMMHALNGDYAADANDHSNMNVWAENNTTGEPSVQGRARMLYSSDVDMVIRKTDES
jgi:hypothetical protein